MTLQQLKYFLEVASEQRFTTAANNLYVAQSSLSYAIQELEHELCVPLFSRNFNKKVVLTEYGETFKPYAQEIFDVLSKGEKALKKLSNPLAGTVKLGFCYCFVNSPLPAVLRNFYKDNPNTNIDIQFSVDTGRIRIDDEMQLGRYDLLITTSPSVDGCSGAAICHQTLKLYVPNDHPLAEKERATIKDLENERLIGVSRGGNLDSLIKEMFSQNSIKPEIMYTDDWLTQFTYVALGYGVAISAGRPVYAEYIKCIELDYPRAERDLLMFWPKNRELSEATKFVRDYIIEKCKEY